MSEKINVNEFKPGVTFKRDNNVFIVIESSHSKSGRGQAHVKCKLKNLLTNSVQQITFVGGEKVDKAFVERKKMQFLYMDSNKGIFMDYETFEQIEIEEELIKEQLKYMPEGLETQIVLYESKVIGVELPTNIEMVVTEAPDAVKGDTVTNATKKITLETGLEIDAPQFILKGQKIIVNSDTGKYSGKI